MDMMKLVGEYGDDLYALALCSTKNPDAASQVFVKTIIAVKDKEEPQLCDIAAAAFPLLRDADCNEEAHTFTEISLDKKQEAVLGEVLSKPQIVRAIIHMSYENDFTPEQIAAITGESVRFVNAQLEQLSEPLKTALEKHYKEICIKISADDKLKQYAVRACQSSGKEFTVSEDAHPVHRWTRKQQIAVIIVAAVVTLLVCVVIPLVQSYKEMREKEIEDGVSFEELSPGTSFYIPVETEE